MESPDKPARKRRQAFGAVQLEDQRSSGFYRVLRWVMVAVAVGAAIFFAPHVPSWWRQLHGRDPIFRPDAEPNLAAVDLENVHHDLLPRWAVDQELRLEQGEAALEASARALREAIAPDPNLTALFEQLQAVLEVDGIPSEAGQQRALWLTRAWNQYLDQESAPYFIRADILFARHPTFQAYTYEVTAQGVVAVDGEDVRVRFLSRLDRINRWEAYHGSEPREGAVVLEDRVSLFATTQVWPLLAGAEHAASRRGRLFADAIVAEAKRDLPGDVVALLEATAKTRADAIAARAEMRERHHSCARFSMRNQPWNGYGEGALAALAKLADGGRCPIVYPRELEALRAASQDFAARPGLQDAVGRLAAWVAQSVAIHEARHYADGFNIWIDEPKIACPICSGADGNGVRAEVSARLAEWAWTTTPATTLYRACADEDADLPDSIATLVEELGHPCSEGPHPDLTTAARALEQRAFDRDAPIEIVDFPPALGLELARDRLWKREHAGEGRLEE